MKEQKQRGLESSLLTDNGESCQYSTAATTLDVTDERTSEPEEMQIDTTVPFSSPLTDDSRGAALEFSGGARWDDDEDDEDEVGSGSKLPTSSQPNTNIRCLHRSLS